MRSSTKNSYWTFADVDIEIVGLRVLAEIAPGQPLREGYLVTVDMDSDPPTALVEDQFGQSWSVQTLRMWVWDESEKP